MFRRIATTLALMGLLIVPVSASAQLVLDDVSWETIGETVRFHLRFHNPDPTQPSGEVSGEVHSQEFGAFLPNVGLIGTFTVPQLAPDSFFDIWYDVALADLPPSAEEITPGNPAGSNAPGIGLQPTLCPPDNFWNGNVDVFWSGPGGTGQVGYHFSTVLVCPGAGPSYVHIFGDCPDPAGLFWSFSGVCPGWNATLVSDDGFGNPGGPAPNPLPSGFFDGWICIEADASVLVGQTCAPVLTLVCGNETATVTVTAEACDWSTTPVEAVTWGAIKRQYE